MIAISIASPSEQATQSILPLRWLGKRGEC